MTDNHDRRQFFRESLRSIMRPLADYLSERFDLDAGVPRTLLRPPGAIPEEQFLETCFRSGNCVEACPADAIVLLPSDNRNLNNTPFVEPNVAACVICDDLACMKACPSGALKLVDSPHDIRMGLAVVRADLCVRTHGEDCTKCIEVCPLGASAIRLDEGGAIDVLDPGCVGCGVCQLYCPTRPRAITVRPLE